MESPALSTGSGDDDSASLGDRFGLSPKTGSKGWENAKDEPEAVQVLLSRPPSKPHPSKVAVLVMRFVCLLLQNVAKRAKARNYYDSYSRLARPIALKKVLAVIAQWEHALTDCATWHEATHEEFFKARQDKVLQALGDGWWELVTLANFKVGIADATAAMLSCVDRGGSIHYGGTVEDLLVFVKGYVSNCRLRFEISSYTEDERREKKAGRERLQKALHDVDASRRNFQYTAKVLVSELYRRRADLKGIDVLASSVYNQDRVFESQLEASKMLADTALAASNVFTYRQLANLWPAIQDIASEYEDAIEKMAQISAGKEVEVKEVKDEETKTDTEEKKRKPQKRGWSAARLATRRAATAIKVFADDDDKKPVVSETAADAEMVVEKVTLENFEAHKEKIEELTKQRIKLRIQIKALEGDHSRLEQLSNLMDQGNDKMNGLLKDALSVQRQAVDMTSKLEEVLMPSVEEQLLDGIRKGRVPGQMNISSWSRKQEEVRQKTVQMTLALEEKLKSSEEEMKLKGILLKLHDTLSGMGDTAKSPELSPVEDAGGTPTSKSDAQEKRRKEKEQQATKDVLQSFLNKVQEAKDLCKAIREASKAAVIPESKERPNFNDGMKVWQSESSVVERSIRKFAEALDERSFEMLGEHANKWKTAALDLKEDIECFIASLGLEEEPQSKSRAQMQKDNSKKAEALEKLREQKSKNESLQSEIQALEAKLEIGRQNPMVAAKFHDASEDHAVQQGSETSDSHSSASASRASSAMSQTSPAQRRRDNPQTTGKPTGRSRRVQALVRIGTMKKKNAEQDLELSPLESAMQAETTRRKSSLREAGDAELTAVRSQIVRALKQRADTVGKVRALQAELERQQEIKKKQDEQKGVQGASSAAPSAASSAASKWRKIGTFIESAKGEGDSANPASSSAADGAAEASEDDVPLGMREFASDEPEVAQKKYEFCEARGIPPEALHNELRQKMLRFKLQVELKKLKRDLTMKQKLILKLLSGDEKLKAQQAMKTGGSIEAAHESDLKKLKEREAMLDKLLSFWRRRMEGLRAEILIQKQNFRDQVRSLLESVQRLAQVVAGPQRQTRRVAMAQDAAAVAALLQLRAGTEGAAEGAMVGGPGQQARRRSSPQLPEMSATVHSAVRKSVDQSHMAGLLTGHQDASAGDTAGAESRQRIIKHLSSMLRRTSVVAPAGHSGRQTEDPSQTHRSLPPELQQLYEENGEPSEQEMRQSRLSGFLQQFQGAGATAGSPRYSMNLVGLQQLSGQQGSAWSSVRRKMTLRGGIGILEGSMERDEDLREDEIYGLKFLRALLKHLSASRRASPHLQKEEAALSDALFVDNGEELFRRCFEQVLDLPEAQQVMVKEHLIRVERKRLLFLVKNSLITQAREELEASQRAISCLESASEEMKRQMKEGGPLFPKTGDTSSSSDSSSAFSSDDSDASEGSKEVSNDARFRRMQNQSRRSSQDSSGPYVLASSGMARRGSAASSRTSVVDFGDALMVRRASSANSKESAGASEIGSNAGRRASAQGVLSRRSSAGSSQPTEIRRRLIGSGVGFMQRLKDAEERRRQDSMESVQESSAEDASGLPNLAERLKASQLQADQQDGEDSPSKSSSKVESNPQRMSSAKSAADDGEGGKEGDGEKGKGPAFKLKANAALKKIRNLKTIGRQASVGGDDEGGTAAARERAVRDTQALVGGDNKLQKSMRKFNTFRKKIGMQGLQSSEGQMGRNLGWDPAEENATSNRPWTAPGRYHAPSKRVGRPLDARQGRAAWTRRRSALPLYTKEFVAEWEAVKAAVSEQRDEWMASQQQRVTDMLRELYNDEDVRDDVSVSAGSDDCEPFDAWDRYKDDAGTARMMWEMQRTLSEQNRKSHFWSSLKGLDAKTFVRRKIDREIYHALRYGVRGLPRLPGAGPAPVDDVSISGERDDAEILKVHKRIAALRNKLSKSEQDRIRNTGEGGTWRLDAALFIQADWDYRKSRRRRKPMEERRGSMQQVLVTTPKQSRRKRRIASSASSPVTKVTNEGPGLTVLPPWQRDLFYTKADWERYADWSPYDCICWLQPILLRSKQTLRTLDGSFKEGALIAGDERSHGARLPDHAAREACRDLLQSVTSKPVPAATPVVPAGRRAEGLRRSSSELAAARRDVWRSSSEPAAARDAAGASSSVPRANSERVRPRPSLGDEDVEVEHEDDAVARMGSRRAICLHREMCDLIRDVEDDLRDRLHDKGEPLEGALGIPLALIVESAISEDANVVKTMLHMAKEEFTDAVCSMLQMLEAAYEETGEPGEGEPVPQAEEDEVSEASTPERRLEEDVPLDDKRLDADAAMDADQTAVMQPSSHIVEDTPAGRSRKVGKVILGKPKGPLKRRGPESSHEALSIDGAVCLHEHADEGVLLEQRLSKLGGAHSRGSFFSHAFGSVESVNMQIPEKSKSAKTSSPTLVIPPSWNLVKREAHAEKTSVPDPRTSTSKRTLVEELQTSAGRGAALDGEGMGGRSAHISDADAGADTTKDKKDDSNQVANEESTVADRSAHASDAGVDDSPIKDLNTSVQAVVADSVADCNKLPEDPSKCMDAESAKPAEANTTERDPNTGSVQAANVGAAADPTAWMQRLSWDPKSPRPKPFNLHELGQQKSLPPTQLRPVTSSEASFQNHFQHWRRWRLEGKLPELPEKPAEINKFGGNDSRKAHTKISGHKTSPSSLRQPKGQHPEASQREQEQIVQNSASPPLPDGVFKEYLNNFADRDLESLLWDWSRPGTCDGSRPGTRGSPGSRPGTRGNMGTAGSMSSFTGGTSYWPDFGGKDDFPGSAGLKSSLDFGSTPTALPSLPGTSGSISAATGTGESWRRALTSRGESPRWMHWDSPDSPTKPASGRQLARHSPARTMRAEDTPRDLQNASVTSATLPELTPRGVGPQGTPPRKQRHMQR
eukprot:TRINITY_DN9687_c0_g2_i1.p1 TRINITY_DN9687_c0_g2~~TRINITY_DN9687_c0_g2_i1.p1  ORF type:complete len:2923 (-),score=608.41 TRINITY_DN9687_c0_g2_i1:134-8902(-)